LRRAFVHYLGRLTCYVGAFPLMVLAGILSRLFFWPHFASHLRDEFKGLAAGAQLDLPTLLLINAVDDLGNAFPSCSALAAGESRTLSGEYLAGRNLDYPLFTDVLIGLQTLFVVTPEKGVPFVSLAWPGYLGVCTGLNRAGVALAQLASMCRDTRLRGLPAALRYRLALEHGASASQAAARVLAAPGTIGNNLLLCDTREALVLELSAHRYSLRRPQAGLITVTNHFQNELMAPVKGVFPRRPPGSALSAHHFTDAYSQSRNHRLQELAARRNLKPADLRAFLGDPGVANPGTVNSVVFVPGELTLWVATQRPPPVSQGKFMEFKPWGKGA